MKLMTAAIFAIAITSPAFADELTIKPGNWQSQNVITMTMQMNGQDMTMPAQTQTRTECVAPEDAVFSPEKLTESGCTTSNVKSSATSLSFDMACNQNGMAMTGSMDFILSADKKKGSGTFQMNGSIPGQGAMSVSGELTSKWTGDC